MAAIAGLENTIQLHGRGLLAHLCSQQRLLTGIVVGNEGQIVVGTQTWDEYWALVYDAASPELVKAIDGLHESWKRYIAATFAPEMQAEYCYRYFCALEIAHQQFANSSDNSTDNQILSHLLGFECFGIASASSPGDPIVAGTTTVRNPCYLLAKLKYPEAIDDCRFLPMITCASPSEPRLYYHYRQHRLSLDVETAILLYVCADQAYRQASFQTLNTFEHKLWYSSDPRVESRAKLIAQRMILPYLAQQEQGDTEPAIEIVDLGAGSGLLTARICQIIKDSSPSSDGELLFRVWMIDLNSCIPGRFFGGKHLRDVTDWLVSIGIDYQQWLDAQQCLPKQMGKRIGLIVRFFHNMSNFAVEALPYTEVAQKAGMAIDPALMAQCFPTQCLAPDNIDPRTLLLSTTRINLDNGHSFTQFSLSPYYQGLSRVAQPQRHYIAGPQDIVFLPVRSFNQQCLLTAAGCSLLARILDECSLVVIQDMDLRPQDFRQHCEQQKLSHLAVLDVGKGLGLKSYYCYLVLHDDDPALTNLKGVRIW